MGSITRGPRQRSWKASTRQGASGQRQHLEGERGLGQTVSRRGKAPAADTLTAALCPPGLRALTGVPLSSAPSPLHSTAPGQSPARGWPTGAERGHLQRTGSGGICGREEGRPGEGGLPLGHGQVLRGADSSSGNGPTAGLPAFQTPGPPGPRGTARAGAHCLWKTPACGRLLRLPLSPHPYLVSGHRRRNRGPERGRKSPGV